MPEAADTRFRAIFDQHFDAVSRYCQRRLPLDLANDAVADVFLVAWRRVADAPIGEAELPWLYGVARNVVRSTHRGRRRYLRLGTRLEALRTQTPQTGLEDVVVRQQEAEAVLAALDRLRAGDQEVLRLRAFEGMTVPQIAEIVDCSPEAAKKRLSRALNRLRQQLSETPVQGETRANSEGGER